MHNTYIPDNDTAYDTTIKTLKNEKRPLNVQIYRPTIISNGQPLFQNEILFVLTERKLGMSLGVNGVSCIVKSLKEDTEGKLHFFFYFFFNFFIFYFFLVSLPTFRKLYFSVNLKS